jgi:hypothetical protein
VLLVAATVIFTGESVIGMASIGLFLMPAAALGTTASILSITPEGRGAT